MNSPPSEATNIAVTDDAILGGRLRLLQPARGHRAGTDAVLLAASVPADAQGLLVDVGAGVGAAGLAAALGRPTLHVVLLERDPFLAGIAAENLHRNGVCGRAVAADLFSRDVLAAAGLPRESADIVVSNPPFFRHGRARASPDPLRRAAYVMEEGAACWTRAALALLKPGGLFVLIHKPDALPELLPALAGRLGGVTLCAIHARANAAAVRIVLRGVKGSRAPLALARPLVLHEPSGGFTPRASRLHRGEEGLFP